MAYGIVLVFEADEALYWKVNDNLGVNSDGTGNWPDTLVSHVAGTSDGKLVVTEVWTSKDAQEQFMAERLGAAIGQAGGPPPSQVIEFDVVNQKV